jgi:diacylglycerol kinase (ATP)
MNNKPKYSLFKNTKYAIDGLVHAIKTETSFKLELLLSPIVAVAIYMLPLEFYSQMILFVTLVMVMIVELLNSAVENVVDMVTKEFHPLAKAAKDIGATAVLFTLLLHLGCWIAVLVHT